LRSVGRFSCGILNRLFFSLFITLFFYSTYFTGPLGLASGHLHLVSAIGVIGARHGFLSFQRNIRGYIHHGVDGEVSVRSLQLNSPGLIFPHFPFPFFLCLGSSREIWRASPKEKKFHDPLIPKPFGKIKKENRVGNDDILSSR
jgi:hypothetical protein